MCKVYSNLLFIIIIIIQIFFENLLSPLLIYWAPSIRPLALLTALLFHLLLKFHGNAQNPPPGLLPLHLVQLFTPLFNSLPTLLARAGRPQRYCRFVTEN